MVAPVSTRASVTSTLRTCSGGRSPWDALCRSYRFSIFAVTMTLPIVSVLMAHLGVEQECGRLPAPYSTPSRHYFPGLKAPHEPEAPAREPSLALWARV